MNMADAAAAAILQTSPTFTEAIDVPSYVKSPVPTRAVRADIHVATDIFLPNNKNAKNGTNFTLRYSKKPDLCAVV
jgi:hypothetical protein